MGRIYIAEEGINAQLSVPKEMINDFEFTLKEILPLCSVGLNFALENCSKSFLKLTIKIRKKIVADGLDDYTFDVTNIGEHLDAENFNKMLDDENTVCIDMRNHYESEIGFFRSAIKPDVDTFRQSLKIIDNEIEKNGPKKNYLMYCTGGIRCEKASSYLIKKGFKDVYQLEGGVIQYAHDMKKNNLKSEFIGKNFVFDDRMGERVTNDIIGQCHQCKVASDNHKNCKNDACHLLFIQCDKCAKKFNDCCSDACNDFMQLDIEDRKKIRKDENKKVSSAKLSTKFRPKLYKLFNYWE